MSNVDVMATNIDRTFPRETEGVEGAPVQAVCTLLVIMSVHTCAGTSEYSEERRKKRTLNQHHQ